MKSKSMASAMALCITAMCVMGSTTFASSQTLPPKAERFEIIERLKIGGEGGWDFLEFDSKRNHLFVTRGDAVQVVDTSTGKLLTTLTDLHGSHGVAIADDFGFISNGKNNSVTVFDLNTLKVIENVAITGIGLDAMLYDPVQKRVYTMNHKSGDITVLDANTRKVSGTDKGAWRARSCRL